MAPRIKRVLLDTDGWSPLESVTVTDQATGQVLGSAVADAVGAALIQVQAGMALAGAAAGVAAGQGGIALGEGVAGAGAGGSGGASGGLSVSQPLEGAGGGQAGGAGTLSGTGGTAQPLSGGAGGQAGAAASPSQAVALGGAAGGDAEAGASALGRDSHLMGGAGGTAGGSGASSQALPISGAAGGAATGGGTPSVASGSTGITYVGAGALSAASRTNNSTFSPELPAGIQANDILILLWGTGTNGASNTNIVSGWTAFGTSFALNGFPGGGSLLYRRAGSSETAPTLTANGDDGEGPVTTTHVARIFAFRGCTTSGSPLDVSPISNGGSGTSITGSSRTTATANAMMAAIGGVADANVSYSSPGGSTDTVVSANSASGSAFLLYDDAPSGSAGSKSAPTCTGGTSAAWSVLTFALKPA